MTHDLADLMEVLDLRPAGGSGQFRGRCSALPLPRVFGGQVAAQSVIAAGRTVPADRAPHSLHGYFVRPGDPNRPIDFTVGELRDGRTVSTRTVDATQDGRRIFHLIASFTVPGA